MALFIDSEVEVVYDPARYWKFVPLVLLLTPLQAFGEEVFVRGYLYQTVSAMTARVAVRLIVPSLAFMLLHIYNQDAAVGGIWAFASYFGFGVYFAYVTLKTAGVEHATGLHTANNLSAFLITTTAGAGMPFATIYFDPSPDYALGAFSLAALAGVHYLLAFHVLPRIKHFRQLG